MYYYTSAIQNGIVLSPWLCVCSHLHREQSNWAWYCHTTKLKVLETCPSKVMQVLCETEEPDRDIATMFLSNVGITGYLDIRQILWFKMFMGRALFQSLTTWQSNSRSEAEKRAYRAWASTLMTKEWEAFLFHWNVLRHCCSLLWSARSGTVERSSLQMRMSFRAALIPAPVRGCLMLKASPSSNTPGFEITEEGRKLFGMLLILSSLRAASNGPWMCSESRMVFIKDCKCRTRNREVQC